MPTPKHNLGSKLDRAIVAFLVAGGITGNVYPAKRSAAKELPNVVVGARDMDMAPGDSLSGNRAAVVTIAVRYKPEIKPEINAEDDESQEQRVDSDELFAQVLDLVMTYGQSTDLLCDAINAAAQAQAVADPTNSADLADFSVFGIELLGETRGFDDDGIWNEMIRLRCHCAPQNVA
jgi:hypothetical protein